jgi:hypothetical protein
MLMTHFLHQVLPWLNVHDSNSELRSGFPQDTTEQVLYAREVDLEIDDTYH